MSCRGSKSGAFTFLQDSLFLERYFCRILVATSLGRERINLLLRDDDVTKVNQLTRALEFSRSMCPRRRCIILWPHTSGSSASGGSKAPITLTNLIQTAPLITRRPHYVAWWSWLAAVDLISSVEAGGDVGPITGGPAGSRAEPYFTGRCTGRLVSLGGHEPSLDRLQTARVDRDHTRPFFSKQAFYPEKAQKMPLCACVVCTP
jgi:hypothetical protein